MTLSKTARQPAIESLPTNASRRYPATIDSPTKWRRAAEIGLLSVLFVAPLFMGGRHPVGECALVLFIGLTALTWLASQCFRIDAKWTWTGAEGILLLGFLLILVQLVPLRRNVLETFSPAIHQLLPLWTVENAPWFQFGEWTCLSLTPSATRNGFVIYLAYCLLFLFVVQYVRNLQDIQRVLRWIACATIGMAVIGLAQFLFGNGKFLWFYAHPMRATNDAVKGTFSNENHFAHFSAMGVGPLIWWLRHAMTNSTGGATRKAFSASHVSAEKTLCKSLLAIGLGCVCIAGLMSFSRGGALTMFFAASITIGLFTYSALLGRKAIIALLVAGAFVTTSLYISGGTRLSQELGTITESNSVTELLDVRFTLWQSMLKAHGKFRWFGTGVGSHAEVYPIFFSEFSEVEYTHGESGYFQLLEETGLFGLGIMVSGVVLSLRWCRCAFRRNIDQEMRSCAFVIFACLLTSIIHSFVDFVWFIPACMSLTIICAALACRMSQLANGAASLESRWEISFGTATWRLGTALMTGLCLLMLLNRVGPAFAGTHWDRFLSISLANDPKVTPTSNDTQKMLAELEEVLRHDPANARAHVRLASLCLLRFEQCQRDTDNAMSLTQIREAALASKFGTKEGQTRWLRTAFTDNLSLLLKSADHARRGAHLCPLQGEAYLILGELAFLESPTPSIKRNYLAQALRVRPFHGGIVVAVGAEVAMDGDIQGGMGFWKAAFKQDPVQRVKLVESLGKQFSAEYFVEQFQPELAGQQCIYNYYRNQNRNEDAEFIGRTLVILIEESAARLEGDRAAESWSQARDIYVFLRESEKAKECAKNSVKLAPTHFVNRRALANVLLACNDIDEAIQEYQWCKSRKADDAETLNMLNVAIRRRTAEKSSPTFRNTAKPRVL